jgi:hypothetical protein
MKTMTLTKITVGALAGVATIVSLAPGMARADGINIGVGELQECTISKSMDSASPKLTQFAINGNSPSDGDVDGRDFLVWQRGGSPAPAGDLADWQSNYGVGASVDASEPTVTEVAVADGTSEADYNTWRTNFGRTS